MTYLPVILRSIGYAILFLFGLALIIQGFDCKDGGFSIAGVMLILGVMHFSSKDNS
jgi:hypothetical protein